MPVKRHYFFRSLVAAVSVSAMLCCSGCVSEKVKIEHNPKLGLAQSSDGILTINLQTEVGYQYTIMYKDPATEMLKPLSGCEQIIGDGKMFEIRKRINPRKPVPYMFVDYVRIK